MSTAQGGSLKSQLGLPNNKVDRLSCVEGKPALDGAARRGGRPSPEQARQITVRIIEEAANLFLSYGFEPTSIDEIAAKAGVSKRTFYTRFTSKEELFAAVMQYRVESHLKSIERLGQHSGTLQEDLYEIGCAVWEIATRPEAIALDRIISAEARSFPELALAFYGIAQARICELVSDIFNAATEKQEILGRDPDFLAEQFIFSVVSGPLRKVVLGVEASPSGQDLRVQIARRVDLFMQGCLGFSSDVAAID
jgi:AcrR family transcriptional regulator